MNLPSPVSDVIPETRTPALPSEGSVDARSGTNLFILTSLIVMGIALIAYADRQAESLSLGFLYVLPLALSALIHRRYVTFPLAAICVVLHDLYAPPQPHREVRVVFATLMVLTYVGVILVVGRLADQRRAAVRLTELQRDDLLREMEMAAEVQRLILPRPLERPGLTVAARMLPARIVAGDYYDILDLEDGSLGLVIADVSGKGAAAGLLMPSLQVALRMAVAGGTPAHEFIRDFNKFIYSITQGERYISLFYGCLSPASGVLNYANAGHNPPMLVRADGTKKSLDRGGLVLGALPAAEYEEGQVPVKEGDVLVLYTDGIVECEDQRGEPFSASRLARVVVESRHLPAKEIVAAICEQALRFVAPETLQDDATVVVIKMSEESELSASDQVAMDLRVPTA